MYAIGISAGDDPLDEAKLRFVREPAEIAFPTFAAALARNAAPTIGDLGGDYANSVLLAEQLEIHRELPPAGTAIAESVLAAVKDRGPRRGAIIVIRTRLMDPHGEPYATVTAHLFVHGGDGCGSSAEPPPILPPVPGEQCGASAGIRTRPDQAIIYALSGDANPLHLDPAEALSRGFERPILHGLCTFALAARAIIATFAPDCPQALRTLDARFSSPLFPGETLRFKFWRHDGKIAFAAFAEARGVRVLDNGWATLAL